MELTVGTILEGKVKSITQFGAFISLPENKTGMVHISEVANTYVSDIRNHVTEGDTVKVMVTGINEAGKISLSMKRCAAPAEEKKTYEKKPVQKTERTERKPYNTDTKTESKPAQSAKQPLSFEDKLKQFMTESDSKIAGCRQYEHKTKSRKR